MGHTSETNDLTDPRNPSLEARNRLVRELARRGLIRSAAVRAAFTAVPREVFVAAFAEREGLEAVYRDEAIVTRKDRYGVPTSSSSQPAIMAEMLEQLRLEPGMRVLEVGAGTGYNAALLESIVGPAGKVTTVDVDRGVARDARAALRRSGSGVRVVVGDGRDGVANGAPYDRIIVTASAAAVAGAWHEQLREGGLLVVPLRVRPDLQVIPTLRRSGTRFVSAATVGGGFMPLRSPDEEDVLPQTTPCLLAYEQTRTRPAEPYLQISGEGIPSRSGKAKRRLLRIGLEPGRRVPLGLRADPDALLIYLRLVLPRARVIQLLPGRNVGLATRDGASLAYVGWPVRCCGGRIASLTAHGDERAAEALAAEVRRWHERGRPGPGNLHFSIDYADPKPELRRRWRFQPVVSG
jgi:protein-L-isoaspartate(D-aspartate) O-methyltransferase